MTAAEARLIKTATLATLIVEDNPTDVLLLEEALGRQSLPPGRAATIDECRAILNRESFDVILLDLGLPDSQGLDTLRAVRALAPDSPIVVLTGIEDEETGIEAMKNGAQDYLCKGHLGQALLSRVIRYAVERHRRYLSNDAERQDQEINSVERLSEHPGTAITAHMYGGHNLRERNPEQFLDLFDRYRDLLERAVEERTFKVETSTLSEDLRGIAQSIAALRGSPRDVIEIHVASLKSATESAPPARAKAYLEEGRILVLELMGFLAGFYRNYYPGLREGNQKHQQQ